MCEWCGHEHAQDTLCVKRPKWSRRGFLALFGAGIASAIIAPSLPLADLFAPAPPVVAIRACGSSGAMVAAAWEAYVCNDPVDNIFSKHWLLESLRDEGVMADFTSKHVSLLHLYEPNDPRRLPL